MTKDAKKDIKNRFMKYVVPSVAAMWVYTIYTMVDGMFVARGVGTTALAAVNISMPFINTAFALGILFAVGASTKASIYKGQGDMEKANKVIHRQYSYRLQFSADCCYRGASEFGTSGYDAGR